MTAAMHSVQLHQTLRAVELNPGRTIAELGEATRVKDLELLRERLVELEQAGKVYRGALITCHVTGKNAAPWHVGADPMDSTDCLPSSLVTGYAMAMSELQAPLPLSAAEAA